MREILFRGKSIISGEWVFGTPVCVEENTCPTDRVLLVRAANYDELDNFLPQYESEEVIPETVGQFTGLCDRHGKRVFEGDILEDKHTTERSVVEFGEFNCGCCYSVFGYTGVDGVGLKPESYLDAVVGNIHDNPELLDTKPES